MEKYKNTYNTIKKVYEEINKLGISVYMIGGISVAIQANIDLYRQNSDIDLMVEKRDLEKLIQSLEKVGYKVEDKRMNLTRNYIDENGVFHSIDHELNANIEDSNMLGVGIFVYERSSENIIRTSYAYDEREKSIVAWQKVMPEELFDLTYDNDAINYKGTMVKCQSKEYTYLSKSRGTREKDKVDSKIIERYIGPQEQKIIDRIKILQKRIKEYKTIYDKDGNIISSEKQPEMEDKIKNYIAQIVQSQEGISNEEIKQIVLNDKTVKTLMESDEDIRTIMNLWKESQIEGDMSEIARNIAHEYYYTDEPYVISTNSLGKISINTPVSESDKQWQRVKSKIYEKIHEKEDDDKEAYFQNN